LPDYLRAALQAAANNASSALVDLPGGLPRPQLSESMFRSGFARLWLIHLALSSDRQLQFFWVATERLNDLALNGVDESGRSCGGTSRSCG